MYSPQHNRRCIFDAFRGCNANSTHRPPLRDRCIPLRQPELRLVRDELQSGDIQLQELRAHAAGGANSVSRRRLPHGNMYLVYVA